MQGTALDRQSYVIECARPAMPTDSEKDGEGRALGRAAGMLHSYKYSHDAILSHVGSDSDGEEAS